MRAELATEAAALEFAETHGLPAPRLLAADLEGEDAGCLALLITHLDGTDRIPAAADQGRLRGLGAAAAAFHRVPLIPTRELPMRHRHMPWIDLSAERLRGEQPTTALLERADHLIEQVKPPTTPTVFVHGDLWAGNTIWRDGAYVGTIDWEAAGAGSYGVDLGSLRLDAALLYGPDAPDEVLAGWEAASEERAGDVAYWDIVAAVNTSADMTGFMPTMHQAGRTDLDAQQLTSRRDAFLAAALSRLG
jgi:aminoglycoside phosphotransferase (APT) family kinase protein